MSAVDSDDFSLQPLQSVTGVCVTSQVPGQHAGRRSHSHYNLSKFSATVHVSIKWLQLFATEKNNT